MKLKDGFVVKPANTAGITDKNAANAEIRNSLYSFGGSSLSIYTSVSFGIIVLKPRNIIDRIDRSKKMKKLHDMIHQ